MSSPSNKPLWTIAVTSALAMATLGGCDYIDTATGRASRDVDREVQEASVLQAEGKPKDAMAKLEAASADKSADEVSQAQALAALAESEATVAQSAIASINANQVDIVRLLSEIDNLGIQIKTISQSIAAQRKLEPVAVRADIAQRIAAVKGGPDQPDWFAHEKTPLPTLSKVKQDISSLDSQITRLEEQVKGFASQRAELLKQADALSQQSESTTGEQSVELFKKASDLRKRGAELSIQTDQANASLVPLRDAQAIARQQEQMLNDVLKGYQQQLAYAEDGWKKVQEGIAAQEAQLKQIAQAAASTASDEAVDLKTAPSIEAKAAIIGRLLKINDASVETAIQNLHNAASHFEQAAKAADAVQTRLSGLMRDPANAKSVEQSAWKQLAAAMSPMQYRLRQAQVEQTLGGVLSSQLQLVQSRIATGNGLKPSYQPLGIAVPAVLADADLEQRRQTLFDDASKAFDQSASTLNTIVESPGGAAARPAAIVAQILGQYGWYRLEMVMGNSDRAQSHLQLAETAVKEAASRNVPLPSLPMELRSAQATPPGGA